MPSTRKRTRRTTGLSSLILAQLGMGTGINHMPDDELKALWHEHGQQVTDHWQRTYGDEPFVALIARMEGWPPNLTKTIKETLSAITILDTTR